ncbi:cytochrome P450 [Sphingomonas sp.]|uniref:cytochrome P450 n=1 Tax=Sphingomonas sp. TaxID=28214 RepID=UPI003B3B7CA9
MAWPGKCGGVTSSHAPRSDMDLYGDAALIDPYPHYRALRDLGSAVYLERIDAWFIGRFTDVRAGLGDWRTFSSAQGIGLNPTINAAWREALICQDPPIHTERRKVMAPALGASALKPLEATIGARADALAARIAEMGCFDGVADFAHDLPINLVMDLIGWPDDVRPGLLAIADGAWNAAGPMNARTEQGLATLAAMMALIADIYDANRVTPGGFASQLIEAAHAGVINRETAIGMLAGYIVAAFETTIAAMASGLALFAANPAEWGKFRNDPALAVHAANEIVRIDPPLQLFARVATADATLSDGTVVPASARVILSYASANRDERAFAAPDAFRIDRRERLQLGFGHGPHGCLGQALARMELVAVFTALARRVRRLELNGTPQRIVNNVTLGFAHLPMRAIAA